MGPKGSARERAVILLICFGYLTLSSTFAVMSRERVFDYTTTAAAAVLGLELLFGLIAGLILARRGWTLADFGCHISFGSTLAGIGLFAGIMILSTVLYLILSQTGMFDGWMFTIHMTASPAIMVVFLLVNSIFEEIFVVGYVIEASRDGDLAFAVSISAGIRLLYHTYQGPIALTSILPIGLIFAFVYLRTRNLWPLLLAHTAINLFSWAME